MQVIPTTTFLPGPTPNTVRAADGRVLTVPEGWMLLPPGDAALTRRAKAAGDHWIVAEKKGRKVFSRGIWTSTATVEQIRGDLEAERSTEGFAKKKLADAKRREMVQAEYVEDFHGTVVTFLAFHPIHADLAVRLARAVTDHATPVGSGTVARTKRIPVEQRAEAAVIAWMRHQTTGYDSLVIPRIKGKRREVRRMLARRSVVLLAQYRRGEAVTEDCPLKKALDSELNFLAGGSSPDSYPHGQSFPFSHRNTTMAATTDLDLLSINTIRTLAIDAVQQANSGHPGAPMGLAPAAYTVFNKFMNYDPAAPTWANRDRFVLSNGHASMLLYATLHLCGVQGADGKKPVTLDEIKRFRQLNSLTPGHPEYHLTSGVETTTGPLGQGIANAVGMAIAQKWKAATFAKPGFEKLFDYKMYVICGDGCLMEGVSAEASSLAGHLKLDNICLLYDDNSITIDGRTTLAFTENVSQRYEGYGWNVLQVSDGNDTAQLSKAIESANATKGKPTIIVVKGIIGWGSPKKANSEHAHGEPLGEEEVKATKKVYGWPEDAKFLVPDGVYDHFKNGIGQRGAAAHKAWVAGFAEYKKANPELAANFEMMSAGKLPAGWEKSLPVFPADKKGMATRESSGKVLNAVAKAVPWMVGGSADLAKSNKSRLTFEGAGDFQAGSYGGRNVHFGVREHGMGSVLNGMALSKLRSFAAGFLIFSDYGRPAIRLAAIIENPVIYVFTHDSIGVGEDGPTHQPIEQIGSIRMIPGVIMLRPADANEVSEAYKIALEQTHHPVVLALSRQNVPTYDRTIYAPADGLRKGAYVMADAVPGVVPEVILLGTGTEVTQCVEAYEKLKAEGVKARVVSMPSWELFEKQSKEYRDSVLPPAVKKRVCVEMASAYGWERYAGDAGTIIAMRSFGASAPLPDLAKHFGFTTDAVYAAAKKML